MSCKCKSNCKPCGSTKGERGLQGLTGAQGEPGPAGPAGGGIVNKINFFEELTSLVVVNQPNFYSPTGYEILSYTNTTGNPLIFAVNATFQALMNLSNSDDASNQIEASLVHTNAAAVETYTHICDLNVDFRGGLFDEAVPGNTVIRIATPGGTRRVLTEAGLPVEFRFGQAYLKQSGSLLKKVTLLNNETITLMFKNKGANNNLSSGQIFGVELDQ
tara:strand:- start:16172 stop:16822 length:651 start_codon:yes stop_codon:yes gene_type:complete